MTFDDVDGDIQAQQFGVPTGTNDAVPVGYQLVHRTAIVRLGPSMHIHSSDHHASVGVLSAAAWKDPNTNEWMLKVVTDFDESREFVLYAAAIPDQSLVKKGLLVAGASGGSASTVFRLQSVKALPYGGSSYAAGTALPPQTSGFNSGVDNLWVQIVSLRALV